MDWEVGQTVLVVPNDPRSKPRNETIGWVSRKWVSFEPAWRGRFDKATGLIDGGRGYSPLGKVWPSIEAYEEHQYIQEKWRKMCRNFQYQAPPHMTKFDLDLICDLVYGKQSQ